MKLKNIGKALLFPHIAVMMVLTPVAVAFLVFTMLFAESDSAVAVISYVLAFYTLAVWCMRIPNLIGFIKRFRFKNRYARQFIDDTHYRITVTLYSSLIINTAYAVFQLGLGVKHHTFWYYSLAGYYILLAVMRFFLVKYTSRHKPSENMQAELVRYRICGVIFLIMNLALSLIVFFMVYWNRTFIHHEITTITMAAYTFTALTFAIINIIKYRKMGSPVYSASKAISLASACVSMLTLEATMLTTFGNESLSPDTRKILLGVSGGVISALIISMAIYMIVKSTRKINLLSSEKGETNGQ